LLILRERERSAATSAAGAPWSLGRAYAAREVSRANAREMSKTSERKRGWRLAPRERSLRERDEPREARDIPRAVRSDGLVEMRRGIGRRERVEGRVVGRALRQDHGVEEGSEARAPLAVDDDEGRAVGVVGGRGRDVRFQLLPGRGGIDARGEL